MIRVHLADEVVDFDAATRFSTETDFNNLCIWGGSQADVLLAVFADGKWDMVEVIDDEH